jgi:hypothetical protein
LAREAFPLIFARGDATCEGIAPDASRPAIAFAEAEPLCFSLPDARH